MSSEDEEEFVPEEEEVGIIGEITGKNTEGLEKLASEEKSSEYRSTSRYVRKLKTLYRKYLKRSEAKTQTIKA
ncbi:MAG: hypothetical protein ABEK04_01915 [Candidatus Nanohalobium sp.]